MPADVLGLLHSLQGTLTALADSWLAAGASDFGVWVEGRPWRCWPAASTRLERPDLTAPILWAGQVLGECRIAGLAGPAVALRLTTEAELLGRLFQQESELQGMTAALIDCQDQMLALYDLSASTRNHVGVRQTLSALMREAARLVQTEGAFAILAEKDRPALIEHHPRLTLPDATALGLLQQTLAAPSTEGELVLNESEASAVLGPAAGVRNLLLEPIRLRETIVAGLGLLNKRNGNFNSPDIKLARAIAQQAGAQLENALLYQDTLEQAKLQHEMDLAARVQLTLLPRRLPRVPGLDLYARSRPAMRVGGDFYDLIALKDRPFMFTFGDVSGKGISAALLMAMIYKTLHRWASSLPDPTPQAVMERSSQDMYDDLVELGMFATTFVGQYDVASRRLSYANAGHSPVIYCPTGRPAQLLLADDVPLGVLPPEYPQSRSLLLQPGDALVVASDGFSEARNQAGEMFGYDNLLRHIEGLTHANQSAETMTASLFALLSDYGAGCPQDDDQTLIVIRGVLS